MKLAIVDFPRHVRVPTEDGKEQLETQVRAKDGYELELEGDWISVTRHGRTIRTHAAGASVEGGVPDDLGPIGNAIREFGVHAKETAGQPLETVGEAMERLAAPAAKPKGKRR